MELEENPSMLHRIVTNPGLSHITDMIFLFLDAKTLIVCTDVCNDWKWYIIDNRLLRKHVLKRLNSNEFSSAPEKSHNRLLLKRLLGARFEPNHDEIIDTEKEFHSYHTFVTRMDPNETERKLSVTKLPQVQVYFLADCHVLD